MEAEQKTQNEGQGTMSLDDMLDAADRYWTTYFDDAVLIHDLDITLLSEEDRSRIARIIEMLAASNTTMVQFLRDNLDTFAEHEANGTYLVEMAGE